MQKPTKAFADMIVELADRLEAVLVEIYSDGAIFVSPDSLRAAARDFTKNADAGQLDGQPLQLPGRFEPLRRCTSCGTVVDEYGDYSCMDDGAVVDHVRDYLGWFEVTRRELSPTPGMPTRAADEGAAEEAVRAAVESFADEAIDAVKEAVNQFEPPLIDGAQMVADALIAAIEKAKGDGE
ncbi:hypothetical protein [Mycobacteroides abscessus]|uniref:hypothetical protein n=1 Tax=Mycobacteroides abscessus TaxID=36809 RepID=UPI001AF4DBFA|nr:hypothetical protein [Mycobacteroides abscessus]QST90280.1 hypothetical protein PROPHIGD62-1_7 [Mycobacterium phage prophi62-1]